MPQHPHPATAPDDPRDLSGPFHHHVEVTVRFADTDAMGHVNNAKYLTYCEIARIRYWTDVTGEPISLGTEGARASSWPKRGSPTGPPRSTERS
jgi:hypothetical protein